VAGAAAGSATLPSFAASGCDAIVFARWSLTLLHDAEPKINAESTNNVIAGDFMMDLQ
jgi:hypothetical protein